MGHPIWTYFVNQLVRKPHTKDYNIICIQWKYFIIGITFLSLLSPGAFNQFVIILLPTITF